MTNDLPVYDHVHGTGPTLVFVHYWGGSARTWASVITGLGGRDILTIDSRGWGRSSSLPGPYSLQQLTNDTLNVIADAEIADYMLVGHSMGGKVAQLVASAHPNGLRGIVLVGSAPARPADEITPEHQEGLSHAYDSDESAAWARDNVLTATSLADTVKTQIVQDSRSSAAAAAAEWPLHGIAQDISAETSQATVPALVVTGEYDQVEPTDVLRRNLLPYLAHSELIVIPRTGHLIPLEAPTELVSVIESFANSLSAA
ncbi:alpha/beta fold hydrolase [Microbacterium sp. MPKO10]|uniref:alpha/beta fold hydrolase n=1 Tax=Microbacterium sp. MPKO10 TaxID=2989818 RepID=UPI002236636F|nr:alpha/beta hydrolase [Microbacterium sp. MPKO10]MCW4457965.1 alpha/beta hydrolase [Microbacterium sp. MPKO10]